MGKYAVEVKDIKKSFFLPNHKNNSIKSAITQAFKPKDKGGRQFNALNGISFNVEKGDFFGILGRNGSGKSTLLKIISEIYQPTSGSVKHDGKVVSFIELGVGFKAELSGRENVYLNGGLLGFSKQEVDEMYDEIVSFAELEEFMDQKLKNYSSGMKVRLAFSVAIRAKADILILDEVLAVGDAAFQKKCTDYFETLKNEGKTVVLVTHSMGNVRRFCNKAVVIDGGKVIFEGYGDEAADEYLTLFEKKEVKENKKIENKANAKGVVDYKNFSAKVSKSSVDLSFTIENITSSDISDVRLLVDIRKANTVLTGFPLNPGGNNESVFSIKANSRVTFVLSMDNVFGRGVFNIATSIRSADDINMIYAYSTGEYVFENELNEADNFYPFQITSKITKS